MSFIKKNSINLKLILKILIVAVIIVLTIILTINILGRPYDRTKITYSSVKILESDNTEDIAKKLQKEGIIKNQSTFKFLSAITFKSGKYKEGNYLLSPSMNFNHISHDISKGISTKKGFEIPPGYNVSQIAAALEQAGFVDKNKFIKVATTVDFSGFDFIGSNVDRNKQLEGFLLPKEYKMNPDANEIMIITTMLDSFDNFFKDEYKARADELGFSVREIVTIASIIEKSTTVEKEKATISSVLYNRLNLGLDIPGGFPEYPLCSPSEESIESALYPEDSNYTYYYYSDKLDGTHEFTSNISEYKKFKDKYKEALSNKKKKD